ncbi:hypothetical protein F0310_05080 (plasmid) [Borrelia sp. A-FGy1]|uniref:hypothetical protein n=1 Tax=Borrelia sp. A-FGy1 TaxID=2608247 RepID=UPI0015F40079|nr:hypothetical protein [Borrelia sp. A-FGy1]QMU99791.1 hypothetical protein F0310_05080 [Borrelia sp. A-FGy1]
MQEQVASKEDILLNEFTSNEGFNKAFASKIVNKYISEEITKKDVEHIELKIENTKLELERKIDNVSAEVKIVKTELERKIDNGLSELNSKIDNGLSEIKAIKIEIDGKLSKINWMITTLITINVAILATLIAVLFK